MGTTTLKRINNNLPFFFSVYNGHHNGIHWGIHTIAGGTFTGDQQHPITIACTHMVGRYQILCTGVHNQKCLPG